MRYGSSIGNRFLLACLSLVLALAVGGVPGARAGFLEGAVNAGDDLSAFTKWTGMLKRFERQRQTEGCREMESGACAVAIWRGFLDGLKNADLAAKLAAVNARINRAAYVSDQRNWTSVDYWATPFEFLSRNGDCEDYAIAKYLALKALGVAPFLMRVVIVTDTVRQTPHAVLTVETPRGPVVLDNQSPRLADAATVQRYRPVFAVNEIGWWTYGSREPTLPASR